MYYLKIFSSFILLNLKIILIFCFYLAGYFFNKELKKYSNDLYTFKYSYSSEKLINIIILIICFLALMFCGIYIRINNYGIYYDLYFAYISFNYYIKNTLMFSIFIDVLFFISFFYFLIKIANGLKSLLFTHVLKMHLYLISHEKDLLNPKSYVILMKNFINYVEFIKILPFKFLSPFLFFVKDKKYKEDIKLKVMLNYAFFNFFLIFLIILFDIFFNELYIKHVFYLLPFCFITYLFFGLSKFYSTVDTIDFVLSSLYYSGIKEIIDEKFENVVVFNNNFKCSYTIYMLSIQFMANDFKYDTSIFIPDMKIHFNI